MFLTEIKLCYHSVITFRYIYLWKVVEFLFIALKTITVIKSKPTYCWCPLIQRLETLPLPFCSHPETYIFRQCIQLILLVSLLWAVSVSDRVLKGLLAWQEDLVFFVVYVFITLSLCWKAHPDIHHFELPRLSWGKGGLETFSGNSWEATIWQTDLCNNH